MLALTSRVRQGHRKLRNDSSEESLNITEIKNKLFTKLDTQTNDRSLSNNRDKKLAQHVDKNVVRNSSPTKTNLDNLNKSTER